MSLTNFQAAFLPCLLPPATPPITDTVSWGRTSSWRWKCRQVFKSVPTNTMPWLYALLHRICQHHLHLPLPSFKIQLKDLILKAIPPILMHLKHSVSRGAGSSSFPNDLLKVQRWELFESVLVERWLQELVRFGSSPPACLLACEASKPKGVILVHRIKCCLLTQHWTRAARLVVNGNTWQIELVRESSRSSPHYRPHYMYISRNYQ